MTGASAYIIPDDLRQAVIAYIRQCPTGGVVLGAAVELVARLQHLDTAEPQQCAIPTPVTSDADKV